MKRNNHITTQVTSAGNKFFRFGRRPKNRTATRLQPWLTHPCHQYILAVATGLGFSPIKGPSWLRAKGTSRISPQSRSTRKLLTYSKPPRLETRCTACWTRQAWLSWSKPSVSILLLLCLMRDVGWGAEAYPLLVERIWHVSLQLGQRNKDASSRRFNEERLDQSCCMILLRQFDLDQGPRGSNL